MNTTIRITVLAALMLPLAACEENKHYTCTATTFAAETKAATITMADKGLYFKSCEVNGNAVGDTCSHLVRSYSAEGYSCKEEGVSQ